MFSFLRSFLGARYHTPTAPPDEPPCDECEQVEIRRRQHQVADRLQALQFEASLYERRKDRHDAQRHGR